MQLTRKQFVKLALNEKIETIVYFPSSGNGKNLRKSNYAKNDMKIFAKYLKRDREYAYSICNDAPCFVGYFHAYAYRLKHPRGMLYYVVLK